MLLRFQKQDGSPGEIKLGEEAITMGRSADADVPILDERASRTHCAIRLWDGEYYVKDLKSRNGTYVNNEKVEMVRVKAGDKVRVGNFVIHVDDENSPGTNTLMGQVAEGMEEGKGFKTMLREIVEDVEESEQADKVAREKEVIPEEAAAQQTVVRKKIKTIIKKPKLETQAEPPPEAEAPEGPPTVPDAAPDLVFDDPSPEAPVVDAADAPAEAAVPADEVVDEEKPKTIRLKSKPKRPVQIKINKKKS